MSVSGPVFDVRFNVQKKCGWRSFSVEFAGTKKEAEASLFNAERKYHAQKNATH
jgi:hypothetical protein